MTGWLVGAVAVAALALSALGGWPLTAWVLQLAARSADAGQPPPDPAEDGAGGPDDPGDRDGAGDPDATPPGGPTGPQARDALRGGTWIGVLERLAITASLLAGYPGGIAFVIAVKGLGRYPELRDNPGASERFVIGTLASMLWAAAVGAGAAAVQVLVQR
ncbi:MAG TPA: hypothetical protein VGK35_12075 [Actinotalea sp.]